MPTRKMKVEVYDAEGNRYTVTLEGLVTRDKALRIFDLIELLGGIPNPSLSLHSTSHNRSKIDKIRMLIEGKFPLSWFSSREIQMAYEQEFKEPISLSTVSTYLARLADKGFLMVEANSRIRRYRMITEITKLASQLISKAES